jgi:hypothetical protein
LLSGTQTLTGSITSASLSVEGATVSGTHTITGTTKWISGTFASGTTVIPAGSTFAMSGATNKQLDAHALNVTGTATLAGTGNLRTEFGSVINIATGGLFDVQSDAGLVVFGGSGSGTVNNAGTFQKSGGSGTTSFSSGGQPVTLNNSGVVRALTGTILVAHDGTSTAGQFDAATGALIDFNNSYTFANGTQFTGGGEVRLLAGTQTLTAGISSTNLKLGGAVLAGNPTLTGILEWRSGSLAGGLTLPPGSALNLTGSAEKLIDGGTINNNGTLTWKDAGNFRFRLGATLNNQAAGLFDIQNDATISIFGGDGSGAINNAGILRKSAGTGTTNIGGGQGPTVSNSGTVDVASGTLAFQQTFTQTAGTTRLSGGNLGGGITFAFQGGTLTGAGAIAGNVNTTGAVIKPGGTNTAGTLNITGNFTQGAGGVLSIELGGTTPGTQHDQLTVGGTATLDGTLELAEINGFVPSGGAQFQALTYGARVGTFASLDGDTNFTTNYQPAALFIVRNALSYVWNGSVSSDWFTPQNWTPNGIPGAGDTATLDTVSTINASAPITVATFTQSAGVFNDSATFDVSNGFVWNGGVLGGSGAITIPATATFQIGGLGAKSLNGRTINNAGTMTWTNGDIDANLDPKLNILAGGVVDIQGNQGVVHFGGGGSLTIDNAGTLRKSSGAGSTGFTLVTLSNSGFVEAATGNLALAATNSAGGTFDAAAGASIDFGRRRVWTARCSPGPVRSRCSRIPRWPTTSPRTIWCLPAAHSPARRC